MASEQSSNFLRITSREYKLILAPDRFIKRHRGADALRDLVRQLAGNLGADIKPQNDEEMRSTYYLDTAGRHLRNAGFALRVRSEDDGKKTKVTLKHRTADRLLAATKNLSSPAAKADDSKFEEDILPPFRSIFSQSTSLKCDDPSKLKTLQDAAALFPGLQSLDALGKTRLTIVNSFVAHEVFRKLCKVKFASKPTAKMGLSFWYHAPDDRWPLIAECAFDFEIKADDDLPMAVIEGSNRLFQMLQRQPGWFNTNATTKTRYAYEGLA